jgi:hypothetical protein
MPVSHCARSSQSDWSKNSFGYAWSRLRPPIDSPSLPIEFSLEAFSPAGCPPKTGVEKPCKFSGPDFLGAQDLQVCILISGVQAWASVQAFTSQRDADLEGCGWPWRWPSDGEVRGGVPFRVVFCLSCPLGSENRAPGGSTSGQWLSIGSLGLI